MSGHSKWAKTHRQKEATDAKKGASFTKLGNAITIAAKQGGADLESNFRLRLAVDKAKEGSMPKDNIERAIKRGAGISDGSTILEEITYEIFGPAGSVFIVETITDNKNRTVSELKAVLNKNGGQLGNPNSVVWMFEREGSITAKNETGKSADELELELIDAGAKDFRQESGQWEISTVGDQLQLVTEKIKALGFTIEESSLIYQPKDELKITKEEEQKRIEKFYSLLEDMEDINNVYTNATW